MKLPSLTETNLELPQRTTMLGIGIYIIKDIPEIERALIVAGLVAAAIICRTITTVLKEKNTQPK